jgi:O-antigen/teichoic acid export membrane protein
MKYGRTTAVSFLSKLLMSVAGFVGTIVLTRTLGRTQYGTYVVVISVLAWVTIVAELGIPQALKKRISEQDGQDYVVAGLLVQGLLFAVVVACLWLVRPYLNAYMEIQATLVLVGLLAARLASNYVQTVLDGQQLVHVSSLLTPVEWISRSVVQVALVVAGGGITGAFAGYAAGAFVGVAVGAYFVSTRVALPTRKHFDRLGAYARFSWLSSVKGRTFLSMDTLVLALFVPNGLIAVYEIAWNLASLFSTFGSAVRRTLFPEMSKITSENGITGEVSGLLRVSLTYSGLFLIPGLIGAAVVGDVVLQIYGPGFSTGYHILLILTFARLLYGYQSQIESTLSAVDRPDLSFRVNATFVAVNLLLNLVLAWQFGWYGAAAATTISAAVGLVLSYHYAARVINVNLPMTEMGKQWLAALVMGGAVLSLQLVFGNSLAIAFILIVLGVSTYFSILLCISPSFRSTVANNAPRFLQRLLCD